MASMAEMVERCIRDCLECRESTLAAARYCREKGGDYARPSRLRTLDDCAEICQTTASFLQRGSDLFNRLCSACAFVCKMAEDDCDELGDDPKMLDCAKVCHRCFSSCRELAATGAQYQAPGAQPV